MADREIHSLNMLSIREKRAGGFVELVPFQGCGTPQCAFVSPNIVPCILSKASRPCGATWAVIMRSTAPCCLLVAAQLDQSCNNWGQRLRMTEGGTVPRVAEETERAL